MKLLVFSDSHGYIDLMEEAVLRDKPNAVLHLGDYCRDGEELRKKFPDLPMYQVAGNCDRCYNFGSYPETLTVNLGGVDLYLTHGHRQNVKISLLGLKLAAQEAGAKIALFGHTHRPMYREQSGLILMNPGSCGSGRGTYGRILIEESIPECRIVSPADWD